MSFLGPQTPHGQVLRSRLEEALDDLAFARRALAGGANKDLDRLADEMMKAAAKVAGVWDDVKEWRAENAPIRIGLACNDGDSGVFTGRIYGLSVREFDMEFDLAGRYEPRLREEEGAIVISGKVWRSLGAAYGVGNWCWNEYRFDFDTGLNLLLWLRASGKFSCNSGFTDFLEFWERPVITPMTDHSDLRNLIHAARREAHARKRRAMLKEAAR